jgi:formate dehydrogenase major subunit
VFYIAKTLAENRPGFIIWAMGQTQHNNANGIVRASNILMLALGNVGRSGGGCNIYRGHDNVQGATDVGPNPDTLPGYYPVAVPGLVDALGARLERRPRVAEEAVRLRGDDGQARHDRVALDRRRHREERRRRPGSEPAHDLLLGPRAELADARLRDDRGDEEARPDGGARSRIPSASAAMFAKVRKDGAYLLPIATQFETDGSATCSNRSLQWREKVIDPLFESRTDHMVMYQLAEKLGFGKEFIGQKGRRAEHRAGEGQGRHGAVDGERAEKEINAGLLDHRLHRPVARAPAGAHAQHARLRREDAAGEGRQGREDRATT